MSVASIYIYFVHECANSVSVLHKSSVKAAVLIILHSAAATQDPRVLIRNMLCSPPLCTTATNTTMCKWREFFHQQYGRQQIVRLLQYSR